MALVSYVDILEIVGDLKDFKVKLVEGEDIARRGYVNNLSLDEKGKEECVIAATCQSASRELPPHSICISILTEPRLLNCQCTCRDGKGGKCEHVVATLMHIHRNNITADSIENKTLPSENGSTSPVNNDSIPRDLDSMEVKTESEGIADSSNLEDTIIPVVKSNEKRSDLTDPISQLPDGKESTVEPANFMEDETHLDSKVVGELKDTKSIQKSSSPKGRLGRGHRKSMPNPKYSKELIRFTCNECKKEFCKKAYYERHLKTHIHEEEFICDICGQSYAQKKLLLEHKQSDCEVSCEGKQSFKCEVCSSDFKSQALLSNHMLNHSLSNDFSCTVCNKSFSQKRGLQAHQRIHTHVTLNSSGNQVEDAGDGFMCDACGKSFKRLSALNQHKEIHNDKKPYECSDCGKSFSRLRSWKIHIQSKQGNCRVVSNTVPLQAKKRAVILCGICGKEFTNRAHHEEHLRSHTGERPFQCIECGKGFATKRSLRNHCHTGKDNRKRSHMCSQCPASFVSSFMLKIHERGHSGERPYVCVECGKAYRSQHVYQDHLNHHKGIKAHTCKECGKSFTWRTSLWAHSKDHAKAKPYECVQCGEKFAEKVELKDHWEVHLDDKPHQCPECGLGFMLEADCDKHLEIHKMSPSYSCNKCDEKFILAEELSRHSLIHKDKEKKRCLCPTCGQTVATKGHLKVHMMIHTGEKPFECETCHKRFYTRSLMRKHAVFHSNERPFECVLCGDKFPTQGILKAHVRTHTGEKPFSCEKCGKAFPQSSYLKRHMQTHKENNNIPCPQCDRTFLSQHHLTDHMSAHPTDKPYSCNECGEQFQEPTQLKCHLRFHTKEKPYICDLCGKGFNNAKYLKKHFGRAHQDIAPFYCAICADRFMTCGALSKHKEVHLSDTGGTETDLTQSKKSCSEKKSDDSALQRNNDPLNRLIEDSEILEEESTESPCDPVAEISTGIVTEYEIVHVNLVDSSELMKLPEGYQCESVEVYHAESLAGFEGSREFEAVQFAPASEAEDSTQLSTSGANIAGPT